MFLYFFSFSMKIKSTYNKTNTNTNKIKEEEVDGPLVKRFFDENGMNLRYDLQFTVAGDF